MEIDYEPTPKQRKIADFGLKVIYVIGSMLVIPDVLHLLSGM